ncbi:hypothetical protein P1P68_27305 [Streptomyces scabiei]|uniref:hypothetical protein n=1 Tax=Streptomyces scabiei TaxID=1930 RepID=UPI00298FBD0B|nr:hypothetical protein [Streptomyces scabiei]MDW8808396.1 hypothetical protein [Streptomyces scabiei]
MITRAKSAPAQSRSTDLPFSRDRKRTLPDRGIAPFSGFRRYSLRLHVRQLNKQAIALENLPMSLHTQDPTNGNGDGLQSTTALACSAAICAVAAVGGHVALVWSDTVPWRPVVGAVTAIVSLASFAGLYVASRRARIAIAVSFLLTFLIILSYILVVKDFAATIKGSVLVDDFRNIVTIIIGFFFGGETAVGVTKAYSTSRLSSSSAQDVRRADRDFAAPIKKTPQPDKVDVDQATAHGTQDAVRRPAEATNHGRSAQPRS